MDKDQFENWIKALCEKLNEARLTEDKILLNRHTDTHLYPPHLEVPTKLGSQMFGLFYKNDWRSKNILMPQTIRKGNIKWGKINSAQNTPTEANFFMHVELEYHIKTQDVYLRLHLETNRYVIDPRLDDWEKLGSDQEERKRWRFAFKEMRKDVGQFLSRKNDQLNKIGWKYAVNDSTVMQVARSIEKFSLSNFDQIYLKIEKIFQFLDDEDIHKTIIEKLNGYWPQK
jgi:hypothetical protein